MKTKKRKLGNVKKLIINWEVNDGYAGKSRPQTTEILLEEHFDEGEWEAMSENTQEICIGEWIQEDFENKIGYDMGEVEIKNKT